MENQSDEDINLVDYINIIIKRKKLIFWCLIIGSLFALGIYLVKTKLEIDVVLPSTIYESNALIEIGMVKEQPIEKMDNLVAKMNNGFCAKLSKVKAINAGTILYIKANSTNPEELKIAFSDCINSILSEHENMIKSYKERNSKRVADLEYLINKFISIGQQAAALEIMVINLNDELANFSSSKIIKTPTIPIEDEEANLDFAPTPLAKQVVKAIFMIIIGALAGLFAGTMIIFAKEWWDKNKAYIKRDKS